MFFFQAEDGIRYLVRSRGLGDVYKRQPLDQLENALQAAVDSGAPQIVTLQGAAGAGKSRLCLLYTSDAADERSRVDLGGRRII